MRVFRPGGCADNSSAGNVADLTDTTDVNRIIDVGGSIGGLYDSCKAQSSTARGDIRQTECCERDCAIGGGWRLGVAHRGRGVVTSLSPFRHVTFIC